MKITQYISKSILEYPGLFKDINYEKSKLKVLDSIFFTIGNGLEFAKTKTPEEGGYITKPKYKKDKKSGLYYRRLDKPYGTETYKTIPDTYFEDVLYELRCRNAPKEVKYKKDKVFGDSIELRYDGKSDPLFEVPFLFIVENKDKLHLSRVGYESSIAGKIIKENIFLQEDWFNEFIYLCKFTLDYLNDKENYRPNFLHLNKKESWEKDRIRQINYITEFLKNKNLL